jgi:hypothetical protein
MYWSPSALIGAIPVVAGVCWSLSIAFTILGATHLTGHLDAFDPIGLDTLIRALVWAVVVLFLLAGALSAREAGDFQSGARNGAYCGFIAGLLVLVTILVLRLVFGAWLDDLAFRYSYTTGLRSGIGHVVYGVVGGAALGALGGILALALPRREPA